MKRYIKASTNSEIPEEYLSYIQAIDDYMRANDAEMSWRWNSVSDAAVGELIKFNRSSDTVSQGLPSTDGYNIDMPYLLVNDSYNGYLDPAKRAAIYLEEFANQFKTLRRIVSRLPEAQTYANELSNKLTEYYSAKTSLKAVVLDNLKYYFDGSVYNPKKIHFKDLNDPSWNFTLMLDDYAYNVDITWHMLRSGDDAFNFLTKEFNRKIKAKYNKSTKKGNNIMTDLLESYGIDATPAKYELYAESYERYGGDRKYRKRFTCSGNYIAYLSMVMHEQPTFNAIEGYFGEGGLEDLLEEYPTVDDIADHAAASWWGDGDDFIIYLKNLTTGETLYSADEGERKNS